MSKLLILPMFITLAMDDKHTRNEEMNQYQESISFSSEACTSQKAFEEEQPESVRGMFTPTAFAH